MASNLFPIHRYTMRFKATAAITTTTLAASLSLASSALATPIQIGSAPVSTGITPAAVFHSPTNTFYVLGSHPADATLYLLKATGASTWATAGSASAPWTQTDLGLGTFSHSACAACGPTGGGSLAIQDDRLYMAWVDNNADIHMRVTDLQAPARFPETNYRFPNLPTYQTKYPPSLTTHSGNLYMAWRNETAGTVSITSSTSGGMGTIDWGTPTDTNNPIDFEPSLGFMNSTPFMAWQHAGDHVLAVSGIQLPGLTTPGLLLTPVPAAYVRDGVSLLQFGGQSYVAWSEYNSQYLNVFVEPTTDGFAHTATPVDLGRRLQSDRRPALVASVTDLGLLWMDLNSTQDLNLQVLGVLQPPPPPPPPPLPTTIRVCAQWRGYYYDSHPELAHPGQGGYEYQSASHSRYAMYDSLGTDFGGGYLDDAGCASISNQAQVQSFVNVGGRLEIAAEAKRGQQVMRAYYDPADIAAGTIATFREDFTVDASTASGGVVTVPIAFHQNDSVTRTMVIASRVMIQADALGLSPTYSINIATRTDCPYKDLEGNGCYDPNAKPGEANVYLSSNPPIGLPDESAWKYIVAHEIGHSIQAAAFPMTAQYNQGKFDPNMPALCKCDHVASANEWHCLQSLHISVTSQVEGWAQYFTSAINASPAATEATLGYYKEFLDTTCRGTDCSPLNGYVVTRPPFAVSVTEPAKWRNSHCFAPDGGTEYDWMQFLWGVTRKVPFGAGRLLSVLADVNAVNRAATAPTWDALSTSAKAQLDASGQLTWSQAGHAFGVDGTR